MNIYFRHHSFAQICKKKQLVSAGCWGCWTLSLSDSCFVFHCPKAFHRDEYEATKGAVGGRIQSKPQCCYAFDISGGSSEQKNSSMIQSIAPTRYGTPVIQCQWWVPTTLKICWSYTGFRSEHTFQNPSLSSATFRVWLCDAGSLAVLPLRCGYNMTRWDAAAGTVSLSTHQTKNQHGSPTHCEIDPKSCTSWSIYERFINCGRFEWVSAYFIHFQKPMGDDVTWCPEIQVLSTAAKALATLPSTAREAALYYRHRFGVVR